MAPPRARTLATPRTLGLLHLATLVAGTLLVFAAHFRPWEVAFLEEWPLANDWMGNGGWAIAPNYFEWTLSRPLHLVPSLIGLTLSGGAPGGIFLILGIVAAAQFPVVIWALGPLTRSFWTSAAVALFLALHPLWPAGFLQRFLPAQTAVLALAIAVGLVIRWLMTGRARWIVATFVTLLIGFAVYPGPAAVAPLMALAVSLAVRDTTWKRRIIAVVVVVASAAFMTLYSLVITRLISPDGASYELGNIEQAGVGSVRDLVTFIGLTLLRYGFVVVAGILAIGILGAVLALTGAVPHWAGWLITGVAVVSPLCAVVFFGHIGWLQDMDRLGYTTSLALFVALVVWGITGLSHRVRLQAIIAVAVAVLSIAGAARGIAVWQPYIAVQHQLLAELKPVVEEAEGDEIVVVVDRSGVFGTLYTFPLQYLSSASGVMNDDTTAVWLCFEETDITAIPSGGVACEPDDTGSDLRLVKSVPFGHGTTDIYIGRPESRD